MAVINYIVQAPGGGGTKVYHVYLIDVNFRGAVVDPDGRQILRDEPLFAVAFDQARFAGSLRSDHHDPDTDRTERRSGFGGSENVVRIGK